VVSGLVDERAVIETIKSGAYNYVMKNNLERLCVTVERTPREAELFREQKLSKDKIRYLSNTAEQITDSVIVTNKNFEIEYLNVAAEQLFGYSPDEIIGKTPEIFNAEPRSNEIQEDIYKTVSS
jgi:PAS domain-containing protein